MPGAENREVGAFEYAFLGLLISVVAALIVVAIVRHRHREAIRRKIGAEDRLLPGEKRAPEWSDSGFAAEGIVTKDHVPRHDA
jgi:hypothetical protein